MSPTTKGSFWTISFRNFIVRSSSSEASFASVSGWNFWGVGECMWRFKSSLRCGFDTLCRCSELEKRRTFPWTFTNVSWIPSAPLWSNLRVFRATKAKHGTDKFSILLICHKRRSPKWSRQHFLVVHPGAPRIHIVRGRHRIRDWWQRPFVTNVGNYSFEPELRLVASPEFVLGSIKLFLRRTFSTFLLTEMLFAVFIWCTSLLHLFVIDIEDVFVACWGFAALVFTVLVSSLCLEYKLPQPSSAFSPAFFETFLSLFIQCSFIASFALAIHRIPANLQLFFCARWNFSAFSGILKVRELFCGLQLKKVRAPTLIRKGFRF